MLRVFDRDLYLHTESPLPDRPDVLCVVGLLLTALMQGCVVVNMSVVDNYAVTLFRLFD